METYTPKGESKLCRLRAQVEAELVSKFSSSLYDIGLRITCVLYLLITEYGMQ